ncbi:CDP-glycerol glycerophosphotransferase family protein [Allocoprobacillus halotolerans]|uniref:CDP-glycerol glycerophosphotransferase family protein n=1 Tax=Allocoprobacillus halotolerans TaxID=2944914 RepID=A0ABY5HZU0_9FIRM|nr:CDP-glycerol glycerophosphotransferase family protein [Allocoprobacillus halotolerans]UTY38330.1 CDP-glycerol glycerophosphotransferase family protein [Allocoprobacillus halotolerans]
MFILRKIKKLAGKIIRILYKLTYRFISIDDKLVIFISFHGRGYSDNPRAIYEQMKKDERFKDYRFIWFIKNHKKKDIQIDGAEIKEYFSLPYFYYMSKAKYWIINCKMPTYICKKENQVYLQTWHGTPLKRLAHDIIAPEDATFYRSGVSFEQMTRSYDIDVERYNYMISPNAFCTEVFQTSFRINRKRLIETGYPRNDFITNATEDDIRNLKLKYNLPLDKKIVLYAPTWRDNSYVASGYTFELEADFHKWKEILGDDYIVVFKPHYLIINKYENDDSLTGFLYSMKAEAEINELYVLSDILITDYSSVFFDYAVLNRPIYFYMYDLEQYKGELRGFYLDIYTELPGKIYEDESNLLLDIKNQVYDYSHLETFNQRFSAWQTGDCAKKVIDIVFKECL